MAIVSDYKQAGVLRLAQVRLVHQLNKSILYNYYDVILQAEPALQTFRSARARRSAYSHFDSDRISRGGTLGHGVYEAARN